MLALVFISNVYVWVNYNKGPVHCVKQMQGQVESECKGTHNINE